MAAKKGSSEVKLSLEAVREFLVKHDGKVKQNALINHFRDELTNPATKVRARQEFRDILQVITALKTENGEKYILLTKQTQEHLQNSVISRKAKRPKSVRMELTRSRSNFLDAPFSPDHCSDFDISPRNSISIPPGMTIGGALADTNETTGSVSSLRESFASNIAKINESLHHQRGHLKDDGEDLEDEIGLADDVEVLPEEKEWMLGSACGNLQKLKKLLEKHPDLIKNKDFILGYSALHWAAKLGRQDIVKFIIGSGGDIHSKSHGGYTPLHVAAMCGKDQVITQLIEAGANIHARDHSGKKPKDVVKDTVSEKAQRSLGRSLVIVPGTVLQTGVLTLSPRHHHKKLRTSGSNSDGERESPHGTPEFARRALRTVSVNAQMAFMKKKRKGSKFKAEDILHSPLIMSRSKSAVFDDLALPGMLAAPLSPHSRELSKSETVFSFGTDC